MKKLSLLRHAKSGWDDPVSRDFDRPLNDKGKRASKAIGAFIKDNDLAYDQILASPAVRVIETLEHVEEACGLSMEPTWDRKIYLASSATLLDVLRGANADAEHILMVGHNPGLEDLIFDLVPDDGSSEARDAVEQKYPTAALAEMNLDIESWEDIAENSGMLVRFTRPRDLDPELGPDYS
ncbi:SixA phosphatase family protein [Parasphingorhabdus halotolerans]|uniref:Histidine phosphatase family protein n=1 Tax=Parasphingorhabdus halotolerans TaxID=2725558 RepID=A0A6H2DP95_9SPHN|nr:histidine phosphatase family protein [Parasphingorhabdus halotolerans]QJB70018.1 histidine phosphatase family protein [Parasphingorhabdus halotolerans]